MIRKPLRPLARILQARESGESTDAIQRENMRLRQEEERDHGRQRAELRLLVLGAAFVMGFVMVGGRMALLASTDPGEPTMSSGAGAVITSQRGDIVDRNGRLLATNIETASVYVHPHQLIDPDRAASELARIFPELDEARLHQDFNSERRFMWIRRQISPEQRQAVHDIGDPGILFGARETRLYPNGPVAAHIMGGAGFGSEGVASAEVIGVAGVERFFDARLRDPAMAAEPLQLSIDLTVQAAVEEVLYGGMTMLNAKGASGIIMDAYTGEIIAMASLPDFDPNDRPRVLTTGDQSDSPLFNRAVQGVYELGSVFKIFAAAQAIELGLVNQDTVLDTRSPLVVGRFRISDFDNYGPTNSVHRIIEKSSNVGSARLAMLIGPERQRNFLGSLGFLQPTALELSEAATGVPLLPRTWGELTSITASYGHGFSSSPVHLAAGYATMVNGGHLVRPTLLHTEEHVQGVPIISPATSQDVREMLRAVVTSGTASFADVPGYEVGGKTGSADKPRPTGGYYDDKVIATFAGAFPMNDPRYVFVITLDEASEYIAGMTRRTAGWTTVPVTAEIIRRIAPLLGVRPAVELLASSGVTAIAR
ncbi:peptidoglycan D,D-transpeptidase FtsI family protein [Ketogulonicigenium vulgare]|uniref:peptidoglycan D,D-transpeptidase FtsI family protein n=1 Tax=Ketogulonicigenium vulgare TaxID=92945 RepID=UPI0001E67CE8|nr:penicillin-binding protein 2 [Ketogulonicigenium vulgare]ADO41568.1 Stage V sporulation protein D [Ketogulonicigenium vulgare Y25]ALJ81442.1 cell division protein FtsI [Ketogulonicigenium vulgare]ANW34161.1 cell division protein FtsI [Ketogulonicigenium vulgare]AOZ55041.1 Stage V sporulation protein D [Ketogulonicigenium vulgare]